MPMFFQKHDCKPLLLASNGYAVHYDRGIPPEAITCFDKCDCVLLVLCAETYCAMEAAELRVMTDAELVPQLSAIWAEIRKDI